MQSTQIGQFSLTIEDKTFNLLPSLRNMAKIANSRRVLVMYEMIHSPKIPDWLRVDIGREILLACSDNPDIDKHLIKCKRQKPHLNKHKISINDQVIVAASLMRHGIAGVNRPEYAGEKKGKAKPMTEFDVNKIVADAMIHFRLSESDALDLTMSKFSYLLASKFPPESNKETTPSLDAHKEAMKALMERNKRNKLEQNK
jgi:hypothetical protein